jgi:hypothetical protein
VRGRLRGDQARWQALNGGLRYCVAEDGGADLDALFGAPVIRPAVAPIRDDLTLQACYRDWQS